MWRRDSSVPRRDSPEARRNPLERKELPRRAFCRQRRSRPGTGGQDGSLPGGLSPQQLLVPQSVPGLAVESLRVVPDDLRVPTIALLAFDANQVRSHCTLDKGGTVAGHPVNTFEDFLRQSDRDLDAHRMSVTCDCLPAYGNSAGSSRGAGLALYVSTVSRLPSLRIVTSPSSSVRKIWA